MPVQRSKLVTQLLRMPVIGTPVRKVHDDWLSLKYSLYQDYLLNPGSRRQYEDKPVSLSDHQQRVVNELNENGFSTIHFDELFAEKDYWSRLYQYADTFAKSDKVIERAKSFLTDPEPAHGKDHKHLIKHFIEDQVISWDDPMLQIGIDSRILDTVNTYLGLCSKLKKIHLWHSFPLNSDRTRTGAQNWHRDPEDSKMVTVFLYFTDIDENSGPLQYIPSTRYGATFQSRWPLYGGASKTSTPTAKEIDEIIPPDDWQTITCKQGTFLFCDTTGFHRGGYATKNSRTLAHWTYATPASLWGRRFKLDRSLKACPASDIAKFALK